VPFLVAELGPDVDPFVLHLFAALAEKERALSDLPPRATRKLASNEVRVGPQPDIHFGLLQFTF